MKALHQLPDWRLPFGDRSLQRRRSEIVTRVTLTSSAASNNTAFRVSGMTVLWTQLSILARGEFFCSFYNQIHVKRVSPSERGVTTNIWVSSEGRVGVARRRARSWVRYASRRPINAVPCVAVRSQTSPAHIHARALSLPI